MNFDVAQAAFSHLLISGTLVHEGSFVDMQKRLGIHIHPRLVMVVSIDRYPDLSISKPFAWREEIGQQLVEALHEAILVPFLWVWVGEGVLALLVDLPSEEPSGLSIKEKALRLGKRLQNYADDRGFPVSIGIGSDYYDNPYMLHYSYEEAKESLMDRFFQGNRLIFHYEKRKLSDKVWKKAVSPAEKAELLARVRIGDIEGSISFLKILLEQMAHSYMHNVDMYKSEAFDLVMSLSRLVLDTGADASEILSDNARVIQELYNTIRYDKFVHKVCDYWRELAGQVALANAADVSPAIRSALEYLKQNMSNKISLDQVAQYCFISTYHFAHLFKKEVGLSFIDYLNKMRIEKAVHYLETTDLSVQEIASRVGFHDSNYFARKFKSLMNCSASEYRAAKLC
ncbi:helix-turn-helix domain-containing protein [Paenibacillus eucommiae]|uniref:Two-component system response regulator YesN n=1 Tax=Paenibacillus eucommiae TaxID=1355755 RepID=A0ABS4J7F6_9BACL|nr:helix-turn-helix domain-containing protein [Paenibacillus eucommiae]MBP1995185.1 two-component system response regulator YesN [Paenibacillus eucommiae]